MSRMNSDIENADGSNNMWKKLKKDNVTVSIVSAIYGLVLIIWPGMQADLLCYVIAAAIILCGIVSVIQYARKDVVKDFYRKELVFGLFAIIIGIFIFIRVDAVQDLIPKILGILILLSGIVKVQNAFDLMRIHMTNWLAVMIMAVVNIAFAIFLIFYPQESIDLVFRLLGIGLLFSGLSDLVTTMFFTSKIKKMRGEDESNIID